MGTAAIKTPSIFGISVSGSAFMGMSTSPSSGICSLSKATSVIGGIGVGIVVIGLVAYGVYYYYRSSPKRQHIEQVESLEPIPQQNLIHQQQQQAINNHNLIRQQQSQVVNNQDNSQIQQQQNVTNPKVLSQQNSQTSEFNIKVPCWTKSTMTKQQFKTIRQLSQNRYATKAKQFTCPFTMQIMRQPSTMKCCKHKIEKTNRLAEKTFIVHEILNNGKCILCHSPADMDQIQLDEDVYQQILGFRCRVVKTYKSLKTSSLKKRWKKIIDNEFGEGYTDEHLEQFQFD